MNPFLAWHPADNSKAVIQLTRILREWEGTPYRSGQQCKQAGVDCIRFVTAVLDEMQETARVTVPRLPADTSLHNPANVLYILRFLLTHYPSDEVLDNCVQPGDVIVTKLEQEPGHVFIVGPEKNTLWHSDNPSGVRYTGFHSAQHIQHVWRPKGIF